MLLRHPRAPIATVGLAFIHLVFAAGLILQPYRWSATPAYGNLLLVLSAQVWGFIYLGVGIVLTLAVVFPRVRGLAISAHTLAFILLAFWEAAFVMRTLTVWKTTIANVVAWGTYLGIVVASAMQIDAPVIDPMEVSAHDTR